MAYPWEVYCFTAVTAWLEYERIQGDIFDHLLAILPELGRRLYQSPSGSDFISMTSLVRAEGAATLVHELARTEHQHPS